MGHRSSLDDAARRAACYRAARPRTAADAGIRQAKVVVSSSTAARKTSSGAMSSAAPPRAPVFSRSPCSGRSEACAPPSPPGEVAQVPGVDTMFTILLLIGAHMRYRHFDDNPSRSARRHGRHSCFRAQSRRRVHAFVANDGRSHRTHRPCAHGCPVGAHFAAGLLVTQMAASD